MDSEFVPPTFEPSPTMMSALADMQTHIQAIAEAQNKRVKLTGKGSVHKGRVQVTVNANGVIIETKLSKDVSDLSYGDIAKAITQAAQQAAQDVQTQTAELLAPVKQAQAKLPKMSELIEGLPDLESQIPTEPEVSLAPPDDPERLVFDTDENHSPMKFSGVEAYDHEANTQRDSGVSDSPW